MLQHPQAEYRSHKTISSGQFAPGAAIAQSGVIREIVPINSAGRFRFRMKATVGGTLNARFLRPGIQDGTFVKFDDDLDGTAAVLTTGAPTEVTVTPNTEAVMEITDLCGEAYVLVYFTEAGSAAGTVTYANTCQL